MDRYRGQGTKSGPRLRLGSLDEGNHRDGAGGGHGDLDRVRTPCEIGFQRASLPDDDAPVSSTRVNESTIQAEEKDGPAVDLDAE